MVGNGFGVSWTVWDYEAFVHGADACLASESDIHYGTYAVSEIMGI